MATTPIWQQTIKLHRLTNGIFTFGGAKALCKELYSDMKNNSNAIKVKVRIIALNVSAQATKGCKFDDSESGELPVL